ncbi:C4-dicarboxylate transporter family protein, DctQ subunit [Candidatus Filomicrobium marinum]|uniref:TRAP transporter small permease protein n=2 Tax=Filomicrobium TaxID=119044 RepID=A0A0D6JHM3_9HYPH|nr:MULTISPECIES: TRAP transporter small permease subunit [Filomicrobium]MCV0369402.1 TRAP transporter small permease subunit [Filomicrobium sp.]CFX41890.1 C4-dicarboxylate transporter family protein, DctQ subunit [Candidatus Filomicrobium marinum]CPR21144.1 C4-dicarboxylate transporter family protein, DctQ subunit [Candidatus Filomicrobium marinum]SDP24342.1 TRAP-type mannitol/chloroaromatic compound transport system, small permease component [Filomicrobium insigne]
MRTTLMSAVGRIDSFVGLAGRVTAWLVLGLVLLVAFNVLLRYGFAVGTVASQELEWHIMAVTALIGMSYGINRGDEVRVDILYADYGPRMKAAVDVLAGVLTFFIALVFAYLSLAYVAQSYSFQEGSPDPGGLPYRYILKAFLTVGFVLLALQAIVQTARALVAFLDAGKSGAQQASVSPNGK